MVLVGVPGAGKSTVGQVLATRLGVEFRDTDWDVERATGKTVAEVFLDEGEAAFRGYEAAQVAAALAQHTGVLALGGGAVLDPATRAALAGHVVVHLQVSLTSASSRVGLDGARPVLALNPRSTLKALREQRAPLYAEVATAVVDTDGRTPAEIADMIMVLL